MNIIFLDIDGVLNNQDYIIEIHPKVLELYSKKDYDESSLLRLKRLMMDMWMILIIAAIFYIGILTISCITLEEGPLLGTVIVVSTITFIVAGFYALKLEIDAGYYECHNCHHNTHCY